MKTVRAFPYPGAKISQVWDLTCFLPEQYEEVIEPFAGSASFSLHLLNHGYVKGVNCWLNDSNEHLMNFYQVIQQERYRDQVVMELLRIQKHHDFVTRKLFNQSVDTLNSSQSCPIAKAIAYYVFMIASYLRKQRFTYSPYTPSVAEAVGISRGRIMDLYKVGKALAVVRLTAESYECVLARAKRTAFVFLDSPYTTSQDFYGPGKFDLDAFAAICESHINDFWMMITLDDCPANRKRFSKPGFIVLRRQVYYASSKRKAAELMILNYRPPLLEYWAKMTEYLIEDGSQLAAIFIFAIRLLQASTPARGRPRQPSLPFPAGSSSTASGSRRGEL